MDTDHLVRDWAFELLRLIEEAQVAADDDDFAKGRRFGLAEAMSLLQQQTTSFGIDPKRFDLPEEDLTLTVLR